MLVMKKHQDHYQHILDTAENLIQLRGYNAFSYRDIAEIVGIKTSSIHYHFPTKADLGKVVVKKHIDLLCAELDELMASTKLTCRKKAEIFIESIYSKTYRAEQKMCLGGMLASDVLTLPEIIQDEVKQFFNRLESWLSKLLSEAIEKKEIAIERKEIKQKSILILSMIEGSLLLARLFQQEEPLSIAKKNILHMFNSN